MVQETTDQQAAKSLKIVFMGTPGFAVATLDALYKAGYEIAAVVTAPDKPAGRGQQLHFSEVKQYALDKHLPLLQPVKLKDPLFITELQKLEADVFVVVAFRMLPEEVFTIPRLGTFNVHASLLPHYRGAAPIHHAVMNGEKKTGVTTFFLNKEIDKGDIIDFTEIEIGDEETTGELHDRLMVAGAALAVRTLHQIETGTYKRISQSGTSDQEVKPAPKIFKEDTLIDWNQPAVVIFNKIRGLSPYPCAYSRIKNRAGETLILKCLEARITGEKSVSSPGTISIENRKNLTISTKDMQISLQKVQLQGKTSMKIEQFLQGFHSENYILTLF